TLQLMGTPELASIDEWHAPDFQNDKIHLISIVGLFGLLVYLGIRLQGARLLTLLTVTVLALEHRRGLGLFALVAPLVVIGPLSVRVPWLAIQNHERDPVVKFAKRRSSSVVLACCAIVATTAAIIWTNAFRVEPPARLTPEKAISAAALAGFKDN